MHAEVGAVRAQLLGGDGEVDGLQQRVGRRARLRLGRGRPVPERQEADLLCRHGTSSLASGFAAVADNGRRAAVAHIRASSRKHQGASTAWPECIAAHGRRHAAVRRLPVAGADRRLSRRRHDADVSDAQRHGARLRARACAQDGAVDGADRRAQRRDVLPVHAGARLVGRGARTSARTDAAGGCRCGCASTRCWRRATSWCHGVRR